MAACSDSTYTVGGDDVDGCGPLGCDDDRVQIIPISGAVTDKVTGDLISNARVDFFEGSEKATNVVFGVDDTPTDGQDLTDGTFQVNAVDIVKFRAVASAAGYLDKTAIVEFDAEAQVVYVVLELIAEEVEGVAAAEEVFSESIGEDFAVKAEGITLTSDDSAGDKTTEGQAEVAITGGIQFLDENDQVIEVAAVNLEVSYIETQEATDEDEEVLSIADVIPEGLNSDDTIDEVLVPVGVTEVNMTDENGTPIKNFSGDITITLYLPATTIDPATGNSITQASSFRVRTYDTETQVWTTEPEDAVTVLAQQGGLFPVEVTVDHLTIFALTAEVTACANDATLNFTGSAVPATGLELVVEAGDLRETYAISESSFVISKDDILKDEDGYKVYVTDSSGVSWLAEEEEADPVEPEEPQVPETVITVPAQQADTQHVYVSESTLSEDGTQVTLKVSYMADEANLSGVGITVNYDSSVLTLNEISDVFAGAIASGSQSEDSADSDNSATTDQRLSFGWASLFGQFPGSNSVDLATITFDIAADAVGSTDVNIAASSSAAGYAFDGQSQSVGVAAEAAEPVSDGYTLCAAEATTINLEAPAQPVTYEKILDLALQCTNDSLVTTDLANAVVSYSSDTNPIPVIATEASAGSYQLTGLTEGSVYTVTVNTRTDAGVVVYDQSNNGIQTDGTNEARNIGVSCSSATGTGTGSS